MAPIDIVAVFNDAGHDLHESICRIVSQVYTYMILTRVEFSFLSCWHYTWLIRRPFKGDCSTLEFSTPFLASLECEGQNVSTMAALSWIQSVAFERTHLDGLRHLCWPTSTQQKLQIDDPGEADEEEGTGEGRSKR